MRPLSVTPQSAVSRIATIPLENQSIISDLNRRILPSPSKAVHSHNVGFDYPAFPKLLNIIHWWASHVGIPENKTFKKLVKKVPKTGSAKTAHRDTNFPDMKNRLPRPSMFPLWTVNH